MLARLCFDNLLLIDELLDDNPEKKNMKSLQRESKEKLNKNSFKCEKQEKLS